MNRRSRDLLKRFAAAAGRSRRRARRRFSLAPITLGLALGVGLVWLAMMLPRVWAATLPGGLVQAAAFGGWPGLVWDAAVAAHRYFAAIGGAIVGLTILGLPLASRSGAIRWGFRLLAMLAVLLDFGLVFVTMRVALAAAGVG
jgi:hypothetical protein